MLHKSDIGNARMLISKQVEKGFRNVKAVISNVIEIAPVDLAFGWLFYHHRLMDLRMPNIHRTNRKRHMLLSGKYRHVSCFSVLNKK
ncbi:MAG: hypothetical protein CO186_06190 [Zetaproteobacteria bacterium CG_4_9_14_3_um_filter_49_83]|nr:MAG: hypothetical protein AUJ56_12610 [Zetaproteobacteria bacterium CG1_02_49_23]PIQ34341.1 MAG: hypothetical protein COW62_02225 [Zetaproteobacteria bacterium CG17_big_fil_post_rev_8_21_14_2_50_50_13]PIV29904.1 MAG: hypothetical protein COS35_09530 [Zetaproteobacteria bacterium CG02_land_8_20_14_3_00_50_9]PIY56151.1 MAG: hypothetical protein COZ00_05700 [Zetaproteobacteria bacterium CG_4_10_14_0_8_um_filter_49_80]PJA35376.1 MAG: hypothetical protein CO186_06190 [Zetaproteobacteria bacterium